MATSKWTAADVERVNVRAKGTGKPLEPPVVTEPKKTKYRNKKAKVDDIEFDSQKEAARYKALLLEQQAGIISGLRRQVKYALTCHGELICSYVADFLYLRDEKRIVEDVKSEVTRKLPVYSIKKKMMLACHGIEIQEV